jgi:hypothetical protein
MFKTREQFEEWAYVQFNKYGIRVPEELTDQEILDNNPEVPVEYIKKDRV